MVDVSETPRVSVVPFFVALNIEGCIQCTVKNMMPCLPIAAECEPEFVDAGCFYVYVGVPVLSPPYSTRGHLSRPRGGSTLFFALAAPNNKSPTLPDHCSCRTRGGDVKPRLVSISRNSGRMSGRSFATPKTNKFVKPVMLACTAESIPLRNLYGVLTLNIAPVLTLNRRRGLKLCRPSWACFWATKCATSDSTTPVPRFFQATILRRKLQY